MTYVLISIAIGFAVVAWQLDQIRQAVRVATFNQYLVNKEKLDKTFDELGP